MAELETDPTGRKAGDPGAKLDEGKVWASLLRGFGSALQELTMRPFVLRRSFSYVVLDENPDPLEIAWLAVRRLQIYLGVPVTSKEGDVVYTNGLALLEVATILTKGAEKYSPNGWKEVPHGVFRYYNAMIRHFLKESSEERDAEGFLHIGCVAWNALAVLELMLTKHQGQSLAEMLEEETSAVWNLNRAAQEISAARKKPARVDFGSLDALDKWNELKKSNVNLTL